MILKMILKKTGEVPSTKERLAISFRLLQLILGHRLATGDPGFAWCIERSLVARELDALETDLHSFGRP